jgi:hypothetical protein
VVEPDQATHTTGAIYFWLIPFSTSTGPLDYKPVAGEPRSYKMPYTRAMHEVCQQSSAATKAGAQVGLARSKQTGSGGAGQRVPKYVPYLLPTPNPPAKH